jgi:hypothetical protein
MSNFNLCCRTLGLNIQSKITLELNVSEFFSFSSGDFFSAVSVADSHQ